MSQHSPSSQGRRQERRGPRSASALPGPSAVARARSIHRTRAAATELAAHRRRLLASGVAGREGQDPLASDAMLLRVEPVALEPLPEHLARLAAAAQATGGQGATIEIEGHTALKAAASDSRPPASQLRPTDVKSPGSHFAGREGEARRLPPTKPPLLREGKTQLNHYRRDN